jgi:hypothetical protein
MALQRGKTWKLKHGMLKESLEGFGDEEITKFNCHLMICTLFSQRTMHPHY